MRGWLIGLDSVRPGGVRWWLLLLERRVRLDPDQKLVRRPVWLTPAQIRWLDDQVSARREQVALTREEGVEMPQISRSTIIRDWIDKERGA